MNKGWWGFGEGKRLLLVPCGHRPRSGDVNQALGGATVEAGLTPLNLRARRDE